jgi:uncharacterized protein YggU (UPF0235/DUF167 family)
MAGAADHPWRLAKGCVIVRVRLTPKSSLDAIQGIETTAEGPAFKARVRAAPSEGEANSALERLVAGWLGVPKSSVALTGGAKSRVQSLEVSGDVQKIDDRLKAEALRLAGP